MRTAAEIDAAKVLNTTDLGAVTSEVRQFPPGYVTGGRLKLNTNLQIEVAPIAINIAGKDVRIPDTVIIGTEHWIVNGIETPRVPGSWYYLYLSSAGQFAVSPNEPIYNNLYFAYYHPESQDLRAIGKFYYGNDGTVLYVQTSLETASAQVLVASLTYEGEDANYYCTGTNDQEIISAAANYLSEVYTNGGKVFFTEGIFAWGNPSASYNIGPFGKNINLSKISYEGRGLSTIFRAYTAPYNYYFWWIQGTVTSYLDKIGIKNISFDGVAPDIRYVENSIFDFLYFLNSQYDFYLVANNSIVQNVIGYNASYYVLTISGNRNIINHNFFKECGKSSLNAGIPALFVGGTYNLIQGNVAEECYNQGIEIGGTGNIVKGNISINNGLNYKEGLPFLSTATIYTGIKITGSLAICSENQSINNGNLINRAGCEASGTSPAILGEFGVTASNCTWGFTATGPYEGVGCYRFTKSAAAGTIAYLHLVDNVGAADVHGLVPGTMYEWGGWIKVAASASCGYQGFRLYQATTGAGAASAVAWTTATTGWQEVWVTATVYVGATTAYIGLVASASLATMSFDVDNLRLFPPGTTNVHNQNYYNGGTDTYDGL